MRDRITGLGKRVRNLLRGGAIEPELDEELRFHILMETRKNEAAGMSAEDARREAMVAFGGVERFRETMRADRSMPWLDELRSALRFATRTLRHSPGLSAVVVLMLALGIGAAATIFGVVDAVLLRPLPFPEPERLVFVHETTADGADFSTSDPNYLDFAASNRTLDGLAAFRAGRITLLGQGEPRQLRVLNVTANLPRVLGLDLALGAGLLPNEERDVVLVSHELWRTMFAGAADIVGRELDFSGYKYTVAGVLPPDVALPDADVWLPVTPRAHRSRGDRHYSLIARLQPNVSLDDAAADLTRISRGIAQDFPPMQGWGVRVEPLHDWVIGPRAAGAGVVLMVTVGLLLLMACVNVASLLLARATARQTDAAVRAALGAARGRLFRELLVESALLTALGTVVGLAGAWAVLRVLAATTSPWVPLIDTAQLDARVIIFSAGAALLTALLVGLLPALHAARVDVHSALKQTARTGGSRAQTSVRELLVVAQVALAVVLLCCATLMMRSLLRVHAVDTGYDTAHVWVTPLQIAGSPKYSEGEAQTAFFEQLIERVKTIPGVTNAAVTSVLPFGDMNFMNNVTPEERAATTPETGYMLSAWRIASREYFDAAGIPLLRGRAFDERDRSGSDRVVILSRGLAERLWPGQDPIGKRLYWGGTTGPTRTVIGVVGDIRERDLEAEPAPTMYLVLGQQVWPAMTLVVRSDRNLPNLDEELRAAVWALEPSLPVPAVTLVNELRQQAISPRRMSAIVVVAFAAAALLIASLGLYGVLLFGVTQRRRDIGVRIALGARTDEVVMMLVRRGLTLTALGLLLGLAAAYALARVISSQLFETSPADPLTYVLVTVAFTIVALAATALPASRAGRTDPLTALRTPS